jgi:zinc transporter ZupT
MSTSTNENVGIALGLVVGAGASTGLGAAVVFIPSLVKLANRRVLAGSLGFSAGVMLYVSFVEIFGKARSSFVDAGHDESKAYVYSTLCFFCGVVTMIVSSEIYGGKSRNLGPSLDRLALLTPSPVALSGAPVILIGFEHSSGEIDWRS